MSKKRPITYLLVGKDYNGRWFVLVRRKGDKTGKYYNPSTDFVISTLERFINDTKMGKTAYFAYCGLWMVLFREV